MKNVIKSVISAMLFMFAMAAQAEDGVARAAFTTAIQDREPVDQIGQLSNDNTQIYFFTEIRGMEGHSITHRWTQGGETRAEVTFNVGGNRWRVWSSKTLMPEWIGEWQVSVVDEGGNVISQESFAYVPADATGQSEAPAEEAAPAAEPATEAAPAEESPAVESSEPPAAPGNVRME